MNIKWYTVTKYNFDCVHCFDKMTPKIQSHKYVFNLDMCKKNHVHIQLNIRRYL